jgi:transcriptional regulator with GAF, ATPase, and Fis domain
VDLPLPSDTENMTKSGVQRFSTAMLSEIQTLYEINKTLLAAQDTFGVLRTLQSLLAQDASALLHIGFESENESGLLLHSMTSQHGERALRESTPLRESDVHFEAQNEDAFVIWAENILSADADGLREIAESYDAHAYVSIALLEQRQVRDVLLVLFTTAHEFDAQVRRLYQSFAAQVAIVMQNQRLLREAQNTSALLERQVRALQVVNQMASNISAFKSEDELFEFVLQALVRLTNADHVGVLLADADEQMGTVAYEFPAQGSVGARIEIAHNPVYQQFVAKSDTPVLINDVERDERIIGDSRAALQSLGVKSVIFAPLVVDRRVIGNIGVDLYTGTRVFDPDMLEYVRAVTAQLTLSLTELRARKAATASAALEGQVNAVAARLQAMNRIDRIIEEAARGLNEIVQAKRVSIRIGTPPDTLIMTEKK